MCLGAARVEGPHGDGSIGAGGDRDRTGGDAVGDGNVEHERCGDTRSRYLDDDRRGRRGRHVRPHEEGKSALVAARLR